MRQRDNLGYSVLVTNQHIYLVQQLRSQTRQSAIHCSLQSLGTFYRVFHFYISRAWFCVAVNAYVFMVISINGDDDPGNK